MDEILANGGVVSVCDVAAQHGYDLIINLGLPEIAESMDDGAAEPPGGGHVPRSGVLKDDFPFADLDLESQSRRDP